MEESALIRLRRHQSLLQCRCEFQAGGVEKILPELLKSQKDEKLTVGVVNPACAGLCKEEGQRGCSPCVHQFCAFIHSHTSSLLT